MSFTIIESHKEIEINSDIVPCCNMGHGEVKEVLNFGSELFCGRCYELANRFSKLFWWDLTQDKELEF